MLQLISRWVNLVLLDISSRGYLRVLKTEEVIPLVENKRTYGLARDTDQLLSVFVPDWGIEGKLGVLSVDEFRTLVRTSASAASRPQWYSLFEGYTLQIHPIANSDNAPSSPTEDQKLHITKYRSIKQLSDNEEIEEIKDKHLPTIIAGTYKYGARFDALGDLRFAVADYEAGIRRIIGDSRRELDRPRRVAYRDI